MEAKSVRLSIKGIHKTFSTDRGDVQVINGVSFEVVWNPTTWR